MLVREVKVTPYRGMYNARACCRALYEIVKKPTNIGKLKPYIEHCTSCTAAFLRGFTDSEGSVHTYKGTICITNTNLKLLKYV